MRSKQLNFFITPADYAAINKFIKEKSVLVLIKQFIDKGDHVQEELPDPGEEIFQVYLTQKEFIKDLKILSTDNGIKYYDDLISPILQFSLGGFYPYDRNLLQRARVYYIKGYWEEGDFVYKSQDFIQWSDSVIKTFKKQFLKKYPKENTFLYSESARRWIEDNRATLINGGKQWKADT